MKKFFTAMATTTVVVLGAAGMNVSAEEHEVVQNDTIWDLSQKYNTSVQTIMNNNNLDSNIILPGQQISIDGATTDKNESSSNADTYKVEAGDTLSEISAEQGVSVNDLKEWNDLSSALIVIGQELTVKQDDSKSENDEKATTEEPAKEEQETEEKQEDEPKEQVSKEESSNESSSKGETMSVTATAYTAKCEGCTGVTSTGIDLNADPNKKVIAVDPSVIPLGTKVHVEGYGEAIAGDVGGAIKGDKIDVHVPTKEEANSWGVQTVNIEILD